MDFNEQLVHWRGCRLQCQAPKRGRSVKGATESLEEVHECTGDCEAC